MGRRLRVMGITVLLVCAVWLTVLAPTSVDRPNWPLMLGLALGVVFGGVLAWVGRD